MSSTVLVTVTGDAAIAEMHADTGVPIGELVRLWARRCSNQPPETLIPVSGDRSARLDPAATLADLGLGYGAAIHLVTGPDANHAARSQLARPPTSRPREGPVEQWPPPEGPPAPLRAVTPPGAPAADLTALAAGGQLGPRTGPRTEDASLPRTVPRIRRVWWALRAGVSRRSTPAEPIGAFAVPTRPGAGQRYRLALRSTDRSYNLETMIRSASLRRCMVIAVVSPKGGPGKTTLSALLGMLLAELRRDPVIALDANPDLGDLKDKLADERGMPSALVDDLARWLDEHPAATPAELSARLGVGPHGLRFIPTPRPPVSTRQRMIAAADFHLYEGLIARLRDYAGVVLVDCGTGLLDPPVRAALEAADQIVLVTDSSATTARQVVAAAGLLPPGIPTWLVANKMPQKGSMLDLAQVAAAIPGLQGVTVVPVPAGGHLAENIVTPRFTWAEAPPVWQEPIRELAARLANNWGALGSEATGRPAAGSTGWSGARPGR